MVLASGEDLAAASSYGRQRVPHVKEACARQNQPNPPFCLEPIPQTTHAMLSCLITSQRFSLLILLTVTIKFQHKDGSFKQ